jgi:STE24 endopeptidase
MKSALLLLYFLLNFITAKEQQSHPVIPNYSVATAKFDPEKATEQLLNTIPAATRTKADNYTEGGYWLQLWNFVAAAITAWVFLFGGLSAYLQKISGKWKNRNLCNFVYIVLFILFTYLLSLPIDIYQNFIREHQYGFSNQNFIQWLVSDLLLLLVELFIAAPFFVIVYAIFRKVKQTWWVWGAGVSVVFLILVIIIYPVFITPLFNNFTPIKNGPLRDRVLSMARANQVNINDVYVYNESQQTKQFNASVTGFAGTARISLNDNMLNQGTDDEIVAVLGHEMGHYVLNHFMVGIWEFGALFVLGFWLVKFAIDKLLLKYGERWNASSIQDIATLPLLVFLFTAYFFIVTPVSNSLLRTDEVEADIYGLNAARQPDAFASFMIKSADNHKVDPSYWEEIFFYDHPCRKKRILAAMKWKAENLGKVKGER